MVEQKLRAIDLYSGVGGWSLGLRLAGIDVISSYERWGPANETNFKNNLHQAQTVDIRRLSLNDLPSNIDIVVGSPPCTQFSYSNRGGSGDLDDGLVDIITFLTIVDHLKPRFWAMENVPRVAPILIQELKEHGRLHQFAHLGLEPHVVNMSDYGLPQRRRRCVAGNFDFALLQSYAGMETPTLGKVVEALQCDPVIDPNYGIKIPQAELFDHEVESALNEEEVRINRASKTLHTVYNAMPFPDPLDRTVRTITATCTRVSRESIIVAPPWQSDCYRRLSVRERATLQGFPITFQFYGASNGQKLRMVGNAIPPTFTYLAAQAFLGRRVEELIPLSVAATELSSPMPWPDVTVVDSAGARFPEGRTFKFAIPSLRLKSGVRFELSNRRGESAAVWRVDFWFGNSKEIKQLRLDSKLAGTITQSLSEQARERIEAPLFDLEQMLQEADVANLQKLWSHRGPGRTRPFMLLDALDRAGHDLQQALKPFAVDAQAILQSVIKKQFGIEAETLPGLPKLDRNAILIVAGLIIGSMANTYLAQTKTRSTAAASRKR